MIETICLLVGFVFGYFIKAIIGCEDCQDYVAGEYEYDKLLKHQEQLIRQNFSKEEWDEVTRRCMEKMPYEPFKSR